MPAQIESDSGEVDASAKLSLQRTVLSHERTMLAWVRTSTSLITFGFGIEPLSLAISLAPVRLD
jgi:uncharacterized membrane protein YidH (DUF202 family)